MEANEQQNTSSQTENVSSGPVEQKPVLSTEDNNTLMGVLCYLGPLLIISYMTSKENSFVKYHLKQGIVLFGIEIIIYIISNMMYMGILYPIIMLLNLGTLILSIIGIVNVIQKKEASLPGIGQFADKIKI